MATRKRKAHDDVGEVLRQQQKRGPLKKAQSTHTAEREPESLLERQARDERAKRGETAMEGQQPLGGSSVRGKNKQRGRGSNDGLQGT